MYFSNKFNIEVQRLIRGLEEKGATTNIDYVNKNLWHLESFQHNIMKIIPLIMYDELVSSNAENEVYDNSIVVGKQENGTIITARGVKE